MAYVALYRRWRPSDFDTLVGQDTVKQTLMNALTGGHIAHAYLFAGPRGTGKTSTARILAKALNCDKGPTAHPCGECLNCQNIAEGNSMDVLEIDAASNRGIDSIKELRDKIAFAPVDGRYKVYIIDEVHMLTPEASNALLKTLEEPPENVVFILATTDPHKVLPTIHSRCQRFDFHRVTVDDITKHLVMVAKKSDIVADEEALRLIAIQAEGGMRDALSLLDQCAVMSPRVTVDSVRDTLGIVGREALRDLIQAVGTGDGAKALEQCYALLAQGREASRILVEMSEYLRALMLFKAMPDYEEIYLVDDKENLQAGVQYFDNNRIMAATEYIATSLNSVKQSLRPRVFLELAILHLCNFEGIETRVQGSGNQVPGIRVQGSGKATVDAQVPTAPAVEQKTEVKKVAAKPKPVEQPKSVEQPKPVPQPKPVEKPKPASQPKPVEQPQPTAPAPVTVEGGAAAKYWSEAVEYLEQQGKRAISSCAKNGKGVDLTDNVLTVLVEGNQFICTRLSQADYKKIMEETILAMQRVAVKCQFVTEYTSKTASAEALPDTVQKALDAFGGTIK